MELYVPSYSSPVSFNRYEISFFCHLPDFFGWFLELSKTAYSPSGGIYVYAPPWFAFHSSLEMGIVFLPARKSTPLRRTSHSFSLLQRKSTRKAPGFSKYT